MFHADIFLQTETVKGFIFYAVSSYVQENMVFVYFLI